MERCARSAHRIFRRTQTGKNFIQIKAQDGQPDYRIYAGETSTEIGGGWMRKAKTSGREYVSITLADPQIGPRKIYANLAPVKGKKGRHVILWNPRD